MIPHLYDVDVFGIKSIGAKSIFSSVLAFQIFPLALLQVGFYMIFFRDRNNRSILKCSKD